MYYTVYKITNLVNNKIYIGIHQTNNLEDGYMGSGTYLNRAKEKYGLENFTKEYLHFLDSYEDMCNKEKELVNKDFLLREDVYNLTLGGGCGFHYINQNGLSLGWSFVRTHKLNHTPEAKLKRSIKFKEYLNQPGNKEKNAHHLKEYISKNGSPFLGKTHTTETKNLLSAIMKDKQKGSKNSQFGTMWVTNGVNNQKILKNTIIPDGWYKGRIVKPVTILVQ